MTDIDRAIERAPQVLPSEISDLVQNYLRSVVLVPEWQGGVPYDGQAVVAAEVLAMDPVPVQGDVVERTAQVLCAEEVCSVWEGDDGTECCNGGCKRIAERVSSAGLLRSVDPVPTVREVTKDDAYREVRESGTCGACDTDRARCSDCPRLDPVPEATREEIADVLQQFGMVGPVTTERCVGALLSRYSIFPRHNQPGESDG